MVLYHGSNVAIERPLVERNAGFADLGQGFYCTDDRAVATSRAKARARREGAGEGVVSAFSFDEEALPWVEVGDGRELPTEVAHPFGLRFAPDPTGLAAWTAYIRACRQGDTAVEVLGEPAVVRAWIANELVEMVCSGLVPAEEIAAFIDPAELVVQYCFRDQRFLEEHLRPA